MSIADFLSRVRVDGSCNREAMTDEDESSRIMTMAGGSEEGLLVQKQMLQDAQQADNDIKRVVEAIRNNLDLNPGHSSSVNWRLPSSCETQEV